MDARRGHTTTNRMEEAGKDEEEKLEKNGEWGRGREEIKEEQS